MSASEVRHLFPLFGGSTARGPIRYRKMRPTMKHRIAMRPGMLGTVYGINDEGVERYFDYDWEAAIAYSGLTSERDVRYAQSTRYGHRVWWILKEMK